MAALNRSGQSIFSRPKPIDLSRRSAHALDIDMEDDEGGELGQPLIHDDLVFDAGEEQTAPAGALSDMPRAVQAVQERDAEDVWAEIG